MPHAEAPSTNNMSATSVNGEKSQSQTLDHITSYPLISDSIEIYTNNTYGAKSISIAQDLYSRFAEPIFPYLKTPYSIIAPYVAQADKLGDRTLSTVDDKFPAIKKTDMSTLKDHASSVAGYPFKVAGEGRDYVFSTYDDEYKKTGGKGLITTGKAVVSTEIRITAEALHKVADYFGPQKDKAVDNFEKVKKMGMEKTTKAKKTAQEKKDEVVDGQ